VLSINMLSMEVLEDPCILVGKETTLTRLMVSNRVFSCLTLFDSSK
jgi:hypothetical protein